jgi:signal transduction histidine kinase
MSPSGAIDGLARLRVPGRAGVRGDRRDPAPTLPPAARRLTLLAGLVLATVVFVLGIADLLLGTVGALLGAAAYLLLAGAVVAELRTERRDQARLVASEERERVARELHDGVAQELVHVLAQARRLDAQQPGPASARLLAAATRAFDESRAAISTLRAPLAEPLGAALERVTGELGRRLELDVRVHADPAVTVDAATQHVLLRIVGEALTNAARHGNAPHVTVELRGGHPSHLTVRDDGCGFDPDLQRIPDGCFGLISMRERAAAAGGRLAINSAPGRGTELELTLP